MQHLLRFSLISIILFISCRNDSVIDIDTIEIPEDAYEKDQDVTVYITAAKATYYEREELPIHMIIKNTSDKVKKLSFKEHDDYYGKLPYSPAINIFVKNRFNASVCDYSSQYLIRNMLFTEDNEIDVITLKPGETIKRTYDVTKIVGGCDVSFIGGAAEGIYRIMLIVDPLYTSNELIVEVRGKS